LSAGVGFIKLFPSLTLYRVSYRAKINMRKNLII